MKTGSSKFFGGVRASVGGWAVRTRHSWAHFNAALWLWNQASIEGHEFGQWWPRGWRRGRSSVQMSEPAGDWVGKAVSTTTHDHQHWGPLSKAPKPPTAPQVVHCGSPLLLVLTMNRMGQMQRNSFPKGINKVCYCPLSELLQVRSSRQVWGYSPIPVWEPYVEILSGEQEGLLPCDFRLLGGRLCLQQCRLQGLLGLRVVSWKGRYLGIPKFDWDCG